MGYVNGDGINHIDGDNFLANIFLELTRRNIIEISFHGLIKLEYNYIELLDGDNNELENSIENIRNFVETHQEFLQIVEPEDGEAKIYISKEEEFKEVLLDEFDRNIEEAKNYSRAVKRYINEKTA